MIAHVLKNTRKCIALTTKYTIVYNSSAYFYILYYYVVHSIYLEYLHTTHRASCVAYSRLCTYKSHGGLGSSTCVVTSLSRACVRVPVSVPFRMHYTHDCTYIHTLLTPRNRVYGICILAHNKYARATDVRAYYVRELYSLFKRRMCYNPSCIRRKYNVRVHHTARSQHRRLRCQNIVTTKVTPPPQILPPEFRRARCAPS